MTIEIAPPVERIANRFDAGSIGAELAHATFNVEPSNAENQNSPHYAGEFVYGDTARIDEQDDGSIAPRFKSELFSKNPESRFAIGVVAVRGVVREGLGKEYKASLVHLGREYMACDYINPSDLQPDGTYQDDDELRSVSFAAFENHGDGVVSANAGVRLIHKSFPGEASAEAKPLPIEQYFGDVIGAVAVEDSVEVSRLRSRHDNARIQDVLRDKAYSIALSYIDQNKLGPTYGVVSPAIARLLGGRIPVTVLDATPRKVSGYNDENVPIEVRTDEFIDLMNQKMPGEIAGMQQLDGDMQYFGKRRIATPGETA